MTHDHHDHSHAVGAQTDLRMLAVALGLNLAFLVVEVVVGILANSLALLSDAAHMLTDAVAIGLALVAARLALRGPAGSLTYGYKRAEILSAQFNGLTLLILGTFIVYGGIERLLDPRHVDAGPVLVVASAGLLINAGAAWALARANRESLNVEGAFQHNLMDAYASLGTMAAALIILTTGFERADPIASLIIAVPMLVSGTRLVRRTTRIFLEAAPEGLDPAEVGAAMAAEPHVVEVHDLHVWEITSGFTALSAHVLVHEGCDCHEHRRKLERMVHDRFGIEHTTLQVDHEHVGNLVHIQGT
ncbi:MAG TPA: cation diffusion facilitator family transporter [Solirubrobacteraceae bacterium]